MSAVDDDDCRMMLQAAQGNLAAFESIVVKWQVRMRSFFLRVGAGADSEDLTQQLFLKVWKYRLRYQPSAQVSTFLYFVARQVWIDHLRKFKRKDLLHSEYKKDSSVKTFEPADTFERLDLMPALDSLQTEHREVVERSFLLGQSYAKIAEDMKIPEGTVKSRLFNALRKLRDFFEEN